MSWLSLKPLALTVAAALMVLLAGLACSQASPEVPGALPALAPGGETGANGRGGGPTLTARRLDAGRVALRSPTFR